MRVRFDVEERDGKLMASWRGIECPDSEVIMVQAGAKRMVLKTPGHSYWSGRGSRGFSGAEFEIVQIERVTALEGGGFRVVGEVLLSIALRPKSKLPEMLKRLGQIAESEAEDGR